MSTPSCIYCGHPADCQDHIVLRWGGGGDEPSNITPACKSCNSAKGNRPVEWFLRDHPEVLARVRAYQAGADVFSMLKPGEKPRAKDDGKMSTSVRIEPERLEALKIIAARQRVRVNDPVLQGIDYVIALHKQERAA